MQCVHVYIYIFVANCKLWYKHDRGLGVEVSVCVSVCAGHKDCFCKQYFIIDRPMNCSLLDRSVCLLSHLSSVIV